MRKTRKTISILLLACLVGLMVLPLANCSGVYSVGYDSVGALSVNVGDDRLVLNKYSLYVPEGFVAVMDKFYVYSGNTSSDIGLYCGLYDSGLALLKGSSLVDVNGTGWVSYDLGDLRLFNGSYWLAVGYCVGTVNYRDSGFVGFEGKYLVASIVGGLPVVATGLSILDENRYSFYVTYDVVPIGSGSFLGGSFSSDFLVLCVILFLIAMSFVLMVLPLGWLPRFAFAVLSLSICAASISTTLILQPYIQVTGVFSSIMLMLVAAIKGRQSV